MMVPITRLTGAYLAVATLGFSIIVYLFIKNEEWLTGGSYGFIGIPRAELLGYVLRDPMYSYYLNVGVAAVVYLTFARIEGSRFGRAINAIRQDADAARASGIRVTLLKSQCFVIAAFVAGLAGSLYAHEVRYLAPNDFTFWKSIEILIMVVIGGVGSLPGAILGAMVVVGLPEYLREIGDYRMLVFGAILMATMLFGEGGLAAMCATLGRWLARLLSRLDTEASAGQREGAVSISAPESGALLLEARGVTRLFGGLVALDAVDLAVRRGSVHGLIGPNGAGKTTLLNLIAGVYRVSSGDAALSRARHHAPLDGETRTCRHSADLSESQAVRRDDRARERRDRAARRDAFRIFRRSRCARRAIVARSAAFWIARRRRCTSSAWPSSPMCAHPRSPMDIAGCWRSPARSWPGRRCCCSTSRRPGSTSPRRRM